MNSCAKPFSLSSRIVDRRYDLTYFKVLKDRSPVAVVTGMVANIQSRIEIDGNVPSIEALDRASNTRFGRQSADCRVQYAFQRRNSASRQELIVQSSRFFDGSHFCRITVGR